MVTKLRTVIYKVTDLQRAKEWYTQLTGVQPYFDEVFYVGFNINGFELGLDPDRSNVTNGNNTVAYWIVAKIEDAVTAAVKIGATVQDEVNDVGGGIKVAVLKDLWGNCFGLIEELH